MKTLRGITKRLMAVFTAVVMMSGNAVLAEAAFAAAPVQNDDYGSIQINGATLEDASNVSAISGTAEHGSLSISGVGLYSNGSMVYVPNGGDITLTATGTDEYVGSFIINGATINNTTHTLENLVYTGGPNYIVDVAFNVPGDPSTPPTPPAGNTNATVNYTYSGDGAAEIFVNDSYFDTQAATAGDGNTGAAGSFAGNVSYDYTDGDVTISMGTLFITRITSVVINGTEYSTGADFPSTPAQILEAIDGQIIKYSFSVPKADTYNITTVTAANEGEYMTVGNFLWSYLDQDAGTDDYIGHGRLGLISVEYDGTVYNGEYDLAQAHKGYLQWGEFNNGQEGGALFPVGTKLTVELIPESGYQLTSFTINGGEFTTGEETAIYTFTIAPGNFHLGAHFTYVGDKVDTEGSDAIESGEIEIEGYDEMLHYGTARLDVQDVELTEEQIANFGEAAGDYKISSFLDISLFNTIYKGNLVDSWDRKVDSLSEEATITLKLAEDVDGSEIAIVHETHDGTYELIPAVYDPVAHTITFSTSSFSNYAIASRGEKAASSPNTGVATKGGVSATETNIIAFIGVIALFGAATVTAKRISLIDENSRNRN